MSTRFRVVDSGLRGGAENVALDAAQFAAARKDPCTPLLRFHHFRSTATFGVFERSDDDVRREYCAARGIDVVRRLSGGGALYHDTGQLAWTLVFPGGNALLREWRWRLNGAAVDALCRLGVSAQRREPNDIDLAGRKLASTFLGGAGALRVYQGFLFADDPDVDTMLRVLRLPKEKLNPEGVRSARGRFTSLRETRPEIQIDAVKQALGDAWAAVFGFDVEWSEPALPSSSFSSGVAEDAPDDGGVLKAFLRTPGGVLRARLQLSDDGGTIADAVISGAVQMLPSDCFAALGAHLRGSATDQVDACLAGFFDSRRVDMVGFGPRDVARVVKLALDRVGERSGFDLTPAQANTLMVHASVRDESAATIAARATVMLVPYCAKPSWCKWRALEGCAECGRCEVGDAFSLARERGMRAVTVTDFEHLVATLDQLRRDRVPAFVGMCCNAFFIKRHDAFERAGIPALLLDIGGANCYELQQEDLAYRGRFVARSHIDLDVLTRVLRRDAGTVT